MNFKKINIIFINIFYYYGINNGFWVSKRVVKEL